jgi:ribonuclease HII
MRIIGIDEAGYGPVLGPLVVGAVTLEGDRYDAAAAWKAVGSASGIADSKQVLSHRNMSSGEATVLGFLSALGLHPATRRELFESLAMPASDLTAAASSPAVPFDGAPCVDGAMPSACRLDETPLPRWGSSAGLEGRGRDISGRLASCGLRLLAARATVVCPGVLNRAIEAGVSKGLVDFRLYATLLRDLQEAAREDDAVAYCGKIGGRNRYEALLQEIGLTTILEEGRKRSAYAVRGLGKVEFLVSAESKHLPVAMASMVAKLLREHVLDQWHTMLSESHGGDLVSCSGYRDPVTKRYIAETAETRSRLGVRQRCFLRSK